VGSRHLLTDDGRMNDLEEKQPIIRGSLGGVVFRVTQGTISLVPGRHVSITVKVCIGYRRVDLIHICYVIM
jgi:hypothetical protein